ncbi:MAG: alpha/beta hydrolase, partial [Planctomycetota bacterium]
MTTSLPHRYRCWGFRMLVALMIGTHGSAAWAQITVERISFVTADGQSFAAKWVAPTPASQNGFGILMIGGGVGNDLEWAVPGSVLHQGKPQPLTITGHDHADAPIIAEALVSRGFVVMHYATMPEGDPPRDHGPTEITATPPRELLGIARAALATLRQRLGSQDHVILLGHSLGAQRAAHIAADDQALAGLVLLAPAQLTRTSATDRGANQHRESARQFLGMIDRDQDNTCNREEFDAWQASRAAAEHPLQNQHFEMLDFHPDGRLREWEVSAGWARAARQRLDRSAVAPRDRFGMRWREDVLQDIDTDTLLVFGDLDNAQSHHAPIVAAMKDLPHVDLVVLPDLGHQLGKEHDDRVG